MLIAPRKNPESSDSLTGDNGSNTRPIFQEVKNVFDDYHVNPRHGVQGDPPPRTARPGQQVVEQLRPATPQRDELK